MQMVSNDFKGSRTAHLHFFVTEEFKKKLIKFWKVSEYPDTARLKRDPENPKKKIPFVSERDFVETILRSVFVSGVFDYDFWMERNNPDHPDFPRA